MKLHDMKLGSKQKSLLSEMPKMDAPEYPYGLRIRLEEDQLKKMGITELPKLEKEVELIAKGYISSVSSNESEYGSHRCVEIQITEMAFEPKKKSQSETLYGE